MKKVLILFFIGFVIQSVYAAEWVQKGDAWYYKEDDGNLVVSKWITYDSDNDGKKEYYYFNETGTLLTSNITPDGYQVNDNGQWIENGVVKVEENSNGNYIMSKSEKEVKIKEKRIDNIEGIDPDMIPPKVQEAMDKIIYLCNENGEIIVPWSKRVMKYELEVLGYKKDVINRALSEVKVDWNNHALVNAKYYASILSKTYSGIELQNKIKDLLRFEMFTTDEAKYAVHNINGDLTKKAINPIDYEGLTKEAQIQKLKSLGLSDDKVNEALKFLKSFE